MIDYGYRQGKRSPSMGRLLSTIDDLSLRGILGEIITELEKARGIGQNVDLNGAEITNVRWPEVDFSLNTGMISPVVFGLLMTGGFFGFSLTESWDIRYDLTNENPSIATYYFGRAAVSSVPTDPVWQMSRIRIKKLDNGGGVRIWHDRADGDDLFDNIWSGRKGLVYA